MEYVTLPPITKPVSRVALGSTAFSPDDLDRTFAVLDAFRELGGTLIDTAHNYGMGKCERALGAWINARGAREDVVILDKGCHPYGDSGPRVSPEIIHSDLGDSLERLQTSYVDLYLLHRDDETKPVGPIVEALNEEVRHGRIRAFGGSNWRPARLEEANVYAAEHGLQGFSASSPNLALARPMEPMWAGCVAALDDDREWYKQRRLPLISWSSQAGGFFTGRFTPEDRGNADMVRVYYNDENFERLRRARELGERKGVDALQIALAWVLGQPFPTIPIIGPRSVEELHSSIKALDVDLTPGELAYLDLQQDQP
jgi:aryl-alcohol dehydrogenase-like predicted oxidoreductase